MSRCPAPEQLERFIARLLDADEDATTAGHVRECAECQQACRQLAAVLDRDTVPMAGPPTPPPMGKRATADAPTARLWRHEIPLRLGERPVQASPLFDVNLPSWPPAFPLPAIPGYEILGELGRGGMGIVFKARQVALNRLVALKMIHAGELADLDSLTRFRTEAEAVAKLQHPNIVQIYEVGEADGRPFFSLEYVGGGNLAERVGGQPQAPAVAASLVEELARAVHYAHAQGVIHRDLKPGNILIAECGSRIADSNTEGNGQSPISNPQSAIPKIADFGLAKYTAGPGRPDSPSRRGLIVGTPQYMAPEAGTTPETVGPAADIYSLGAILYEMLTGRPPFRGGSAIDTLLQIRLLEPIPPRVWQPKTPRDLETIALKCLAKEPASRYSSARELAEDLRRFRDGVPIRARPASLRERAWKATRRHPLVASAGLALALIGVAGCAALAWRWHLAEAALSSTADQLSEVEWNLYRTRIGQARDLIRDGKFAAAAETLRQCEPHADRPDHRGWEWHYLHRFASDRRDPVTISADAAGGAFADIASSPDGRRTATVTNGMLVLRDAATGQDLLLLRLPSQATGTAPRVSFSDDGRRLTVTWPGGTATWDAGDEVGR
jgi:serine/threonine protein kinase